MVSLQVHLPFVVLLLISIGHNNNVYSSSSFSSSAAFRGGRGGTATDEKQLESGRSLSESSAEEGDSDSYHYTLAGKTIYFIVTDRFARSGEHASNTTFCDAEVDWAKFTQGGYCGGTFQGIEDHLDYIEGMGFDCIWITPPVKSMDYTGYTASNLSEIDAHFGGEDGLKSLADALHARGMCLVIDFVANHVQPLTVNDTFVLDTVYPFNQPGHYHQPNILPNQTFEDYVLTKSAPSPSEGVGNTTEYYWLVQSGQAQECGPNQPDSLLCQCFPGNYDCPGRSEELQVEGWFGGAYADLDQDNNFVQTHLFEYVDYLKSLGADAFRLDTAIYMKPEFLTMLQRSAKLDILGEATVVNLTYHGSFQRNPQSGETVLNGLLNFPPFYYASEAFCGYVMTETFNPNVKNTFDVSSGYKNAARGTWAVTPDLRTLAGVIEFQQTGNYYSNLDLLGNFLDNHDEYARVGRYCQQGGRDKPIDALRVKNALAFLFFQRGIPIVYYGTEQGIAADQDEYTVDSRYAEGGTALRESLWQTNYDTTTWQYQWIKLLNAARKKAGVGVGELIIQNSTEKTLVFTRSSNAAQDGMGIVWVFLNNYGASEIAPGGQEVVYCPGPPSYDNRTWKNILADEESTSEDTRKIITDSNGCFVSHDAEPKVFVLVNISGGDGESTDSSAMSTSKAMPWIRAISVALSLASLFF